MLSIRPFAQQDANPVATLMIEMATSYGASVEPTLVVAQDIIRQSQATDILVADRDGALAGFATFASLYPVAGLVSFTYIQQIYVAANARRLGIARNLIAAIARVAKARGSTRIEWSTSTDNETARALYDDIGAEGSSKIYYVLKGRALDALAE